MVLAPLLELGEELAQTDGVDLDPAAASEPTRSVERGGATFFPTSTVGLRSRNAIHYTSNTSCYEMASNALFLLPSITLFCGLRGVG